MIATLGYSTASLKGLIIVCIASGSGLQWNDIICIDIEQRQFLHVDWIALLGHHDHDLGSAGIGVMFLGMPGVIASLPMVAILSLASSAFKAIVGVDVHMWVLFLKLRKSLSLPDRSILWAALKRWDGNTFS